MVHLLESEILIHPGDSFSKKKPNYQIMKCKNCNLPSLFTLTSFSWQLVSEFFLPSKTQKATVSILRTQDMWREQSFLGLLPVFKVTETFNQEGDSFCNQMKLIMLYLQNLCICSAGKNILLTCFQRWIEMHGLFHHLYSEWFVLPLM